MTGPAKKAYHIHADDFDDETLPGRVAPCIASGIAYPGTQVTQKGLEMLILL